MRKEDWDWVELHHGGSAKPVSRFPTVETYRAALESVRRRFADEARERQQRIAEGTVPPGVYMFDHGEGAIVVAVDDAGKATVGFDGGCPPIAEWAGTHRSQESAGSG